MKKLIIVFVLSIYSIHSIGQQLMPLSVNKSGQNSRNATQSELKKLMIEKDALEKNQLTTELTNHLLTITNNSIKSINKQLDTTTYNNKKITTEVLNNLNNRVKSLLNYASLQDSKIKMSDSDKRYYTDILEEKIRVEKEKDAIRIAGEIDEMNKLPNFFVSGIGGISNMEAVGQAGGNFSLTTRFRLGNFKRVGKSYWADPAYLYMGFNTRTNSSDDTGNIVKSFLFPDISKRDFVLGFYWNFTHIERGWAIDPTIEVSLNRYKIVSDSSSNDLESANSVSKSFKSESMSLGCKISKILPFSIGKDSTYEAGFFIYPYYSIINVQPKNFSAYHDVIASNLLPATIHSAGFQAGLTLSKLQIFVNMKYVLNDSQNIGPADLQGFTYTIGTVIGVDVLKFNLGH